LEKKISKFKCNKVSVLIILVFIPQPPILEMVLRSSSVVSSKGGKNPPKTQTPLPIPQKRKHHKVFQVQMQYSFRKFFSMQVQFGCLIKGRERKKKSLGTALRLSV
jgi:hypothetical protein